MKDQAKQGTLFKANAQWFHVFRDMIDRGDAAKMGSGAVLVYLVIKTYTDLSTGKSFPELSKIIEKSGLSRTQVKRHFKVLEENGYLSVQRTPGKKSVYILREKVAIRNADTGDVEHTATFDYVPVAVSQAQAEISNFIAKGELEGAKIIRIDKLVVNIQNNQRDGYYFVEGKGIKPEDIADPDIRRRAMKIEAARKGTRSG